MPLTRRDALKTAGLAALAASTPSSALAQQNQPTIAKPSKLRIKQSVCQWCYGKIPLRDFFKGVADSGLTAVDLLNEEQWTVAKEFGLGCSMGYVGAGSIPDGLNNPKHHDMLVNALTTGIPKAKAAGVPNVICFFGNRNIHREHEVEHAVAGGGDVEQVPHLEPCGRMCARGPCRSRGRRCRRRARGRTGRAGARSSGRSRSRGRPLDRRAQCARSRRARAGRSRRCPRRTRRTAPPAR